MTFFDEINQQAAPIWAKVLEQPIIRAIHSGTLPQDTFRYYMGQDYKYIVEYARVGAVSVTKAPDVETMKSFAEGALFILGGEALFHQFAAEHLGCTIADFQAGERAPTNEAYIRYMAHVAHTGTFADGVVATMPCLWGYGYVGRELAKHGLPEHPLYRRWIETYASEELEQRSNRRADLINRLAEPLDESSRARLAHHYLTCSRYEWMFFDMAYRKEQWPV